jgi:hypothetical protein
MLKMIILGDVNGALIKIVILITTLEFQWVHSLDVVKKVDF